jgi:hypothetical protein
MGAKQYGRRGVGCRFKRGSAPTRVVILVGVVLGALASACSGTADSNAHKSTGGGSVAITSASVSIAPTWPNALPGEQPPVRPADDPSEAGATAFAVYFMRTVDWAYASMDSTLMRQIFDPALCTYCVTAADKTDLRMSEGNHYVGGRITISISSAATGGTDERLILIVFSQSGLSIANAAGTIDPTSISQQLTYQANVRIRHRAQSWQVIEVRRVA